jgi:hypothetical protein
MLFKKLFKRHHWRNPHAHRSLERKSR